MNTIGERIIYLRKKHKLTQVKLAEQAGINRGNISHYEKGNCKPSYETAAKIAAYFNVDPDWLYYGDKNKFKEEIPYADVKDTPSQYDTEKDLSDMRYLNGKKVTSRDRKYLENFIEGAVGEIMFSLKDDNQPLELNDEDQALLASAIKYGFQMMRETKSKKRQENKRLKEEKLKKKDINEEH